MSSPLETETPDSTKSESTNGLRRYIVSLKPTANKEAHLTLLTKGISNITQDTIDHKPNWNDDFIKGYVADLDPETYKIVQRNEDVHIIEENQVITLD